MASNMKQLEASLATWCLRNKIARRDGESRLHRMAYRLRDEYIRNKRMTYPHYTLRSSSCQEAHWLKLATQVIDLELDPTAFVATVFRVYGHNIMPFDLMKPGAFTCNHQSGNNEKLQAAVALTLQRSLDRLAKDAADVSPEQLEALLEDPRAQYGPLFKWCIAKLYRLETMECRHRAVASNLLLDPNYRKVYAVKFKEAVSE
jgi:hypothetical protein